MPLRFVLLLICLMPALASAEDRLGRLFFTPAERANLDYVRQTSKPPERIIKSDEDGDEAEGVTNATPTAPSPVTVQGFVKRSDGKGTVWVNRQPVREKSAEKEYEVGGVPDSGNGVPIRLPGTGQTVRLKAGQSFDPATGKIVENLRDLPQPSRLDRAADQMPTEGARVKEKPPTAPAAKKP